VDAYLAVVSKREVRSYAERPLADDVTRRILEAGRIAGSSRNRQARRFAVIGRERVERVAAAVYAPGNVLGAALTVAIVVREGGQSGFDAGRAAQNMMLAAWNDGVGSSPNGVADPEALEDLLGLQQGERVAIVLTFGYPARPVDPERRSPDEWIARADRLPFDEVARRV
jgi:nitroreductase